MSESKKCPYCGGEILTVAKKCKHCGRWLDEGPSGQFQGFIRCPVCDEEIPAKVSICPECGEPLSFANPADEMMFPDIKKKSYPQYIWLFIVLGVLFVSGSLYIWIRSDDGSENIDNNECSSSDTMDDSEGIVQTQAILVPAEGIVTRWSLIHNAKDIDRVSEIYADTVFYYQSSYTLSKVIESKQRLFDKNPLFYQECSNINITPIDGTTYRIEFEKKVWTDFSMDVNKTYPSYLVVSYVDSDWRITTESDLVTDRNLAKKAGNKNID